MYLLRATNSKAICDCFVDLFQHTGIYDTIVMDNGTKQCSKLTTEFMTRLGVSPRFITPYQCQANGLVERFNQSFKSMSHSAMREHGKAWHKAVPFLDSYTFSCDFDLHCEHLRKFLIVIWNAGLTLNLLKCHFAQTRVSFVGYIVGGGRFFPDPLKVESIISMKEPQTKTEVRRVLGIFSFYRNHVEGFARIDKPLTDLTGSKIPLQFQLSAETRDAFRESQSKVCTALVLFTSFW